MSIRVLIADDQPLMRTGLRTVLEVEADLDVIGEAADGEQAVRMVRELAPDVVLMDIEMPGVDGVEATRRIAKLDGPTRVLILTTFDREDYVLDGIRAGAAGYLLKDVEAGALCAVIRRIAGGERFIQPSVAAKYLELLATREASMEEPLSAREIDVLKRLALGLSNKEIAAELGIAVGTVKNHVNNILGKLQVRNRTEAALRARTLLDAD